MRSAHTGAPLVTWQEAGSAVHWATVAWYESALRIALMATKFGPNHS